jgi:hypothetical protein
MDMNFSNLSKRVNSENSAIYSFKIFAEIAII